MTAPTAVSSPPAASPIICLTGPTAAGKSAAVLALAARWPIEVITVDSATVYRGMDVGTAKPDAADRARVPMHLLDIRDPADPYSAAEFRNDALTLIADIRARGRQPVLAGGTMLYYQALRAGLNDLPSADAAIRAELDAIAARHGTPMLHAELAKIDPATAARLAPNDSQRIQRALEIWRLTGQPMSDLLARARPAPSPHRYLTLSLEPSDRALLHARIAARFDAMLADGFIDEVQTLYARGDLHAELPALRAVGYRQYWRYCAGDIPAETAREQAIAATRQLAKRQLTWLRADRERCVIDALASDAAMQVIDAYARVFNLHTQ